jgi:endonuclease III related protein
MVLPGQLRKIYELLDAYFGDLHWWPADNPFEVMVGAILTQNTAWTNVEKAIAALRARSLLSPLALASLPEDELAQLIRPSGYYHLKAARMKAFIRFFMREYGGCIEQMRAGSLPELRKHILSVWGIGPETADSILLYACQKPIFVSDAYTKRILLRHGMIADDADYHAIQALFMNHFPNDATLFNQYHALIVNTGKTFCRKTAQCAGCPLANLQKGKKPMMYAKADHI